LRTIYPLVGVDFTKHKAPQSILQTPADTVPFKGDVFIPLILNHVCVIPFIVYGHFPLQYKVQNF